MRFDPTLIPSPSRFTASCLFLAILAALVAYVGADHPPLGHPLAALVLSTLALGMFGSDRPAMASFMRAGFHVGFFGFFLSIPLFAAEEISARISPEIVESVGWLLILTVLGFEGGYWLFSSNRRGPPPASADERLSPRLQRNLVNLLVLGIAGWSIFIVDQITAFQVPATTLLLTMRGKIEGAADANPVLGYYGGMVVVSGIYLAAAAAMVIITRSRQAGLSLLTICWCVLVLTAAIGFLRGSRAIFFYAVTPLVVTIWSVLSTRGWRSFRWMWILSAAFVIVIAWGAMSAMRGGDIRKYEGGWAQIDPEKHVAGAFNIYDSLAEVVEGFPEKIPYQNGKSLVALALGWVPRPVWPGKPYPFSIHMTRLRGETLQARSASIAPGLPGEGYGNFGFIGVVLWAGLLGFAARKGDDWIRNLRVVEPLRLQLGATLAIWTAMIVRGGVPEMFYMGLFIVMFPAMLAVYLNRALVRDRRMARQGGQYRGGR